MATRSNTAIDTAPKARITVWTHRMVALVMVAIPMFTRWVSMPLCVTRSTVHRTSSNPRQAKHFGSSRLDVRTSQVPLLLTIKGTRCPVLSRLLEQAAQKAARMETAKPSPSMPREATRFTELRTSSSRQPGKLCGSSNFDNPERFTSRGLNNLGISVDGV